MNTTEWIKGKTIEQILEIPLNDLQKLTVPQLRTLVGRGVSAGNKRLRRFQAKYNKIPYAGKGAERNADYESVKFSVMGKDRTQIMEEFKRIKSYLKAETSSVTGYEKVKRESRKALKEQYGIVISKKDFDDFWEIYEKLKELKPELKERAFKYVVLDNIKIAMKDKRKELKDMGAEWDELTPEEIAISMAERVDELYKAYQTREQETKFNEFYPV